MGSLTRFPKRSHLIKSPGLGWNLWNFANDDLYRLIVYMIIEETFYYYERSRSEQAKVLVFNMVFLPLIMGLFLLLLPKSGPVYEQFRGYVIYIIAAAEMVLLSVVVWFLTHPATFYIKLTSSEFCSFHPNFKEWTFSVNPQEILEIGHSTDRDARSSYISVRMKNGASYLLSPNFPYNRNELYDALRLVNPDIKTPKNTWLFANKR